MSKSDDLTKIKELLEIVKHKVDFSESHRSVELSTIRLMKDQLSVMNKKMDTTQETLDSNTASLVEIEKTLKSYADRYQINQHNVERLDTRLTTIEDNLDIEPPKDLKVPHFSE